MTVKRTKSVSLEELWDYEAKHPVVFASPRALAEARLIADLNRVKRNRRRHSRGNGAAFDTLRRKLAVA
jgi:hypothetical protein